MSKTQTMGNSRTSGLGFSTNKFQSIKNRNGRQTYKIKRQQLTATYRFSLDFYLNDKPTGEFFKLDRHLIALEDSYQLLGVIMILLPCFSPYVLETGIELFKDKII